MRTLVILFFYVMNASVFAKSRNKRYPLDEELQTASSGYETDSTRQSLSSIIFHPQYEQQIFELVQNAELICCATNADAEGNIEGSSIPSYVSLSKSPKVRGLAPTQTQYKNIANIFRRVLAEMLLNIIQALLDTTDETLHHVKPRSSKNRNIQTSGNSRTDPTHQLPFPFLRTKGSQTTGNSNPEPSHAEPNSQLANNNCNFV